MLRTNNGYTNVNNQTYQAYDVVCNNGCDNDTDCDRNDDHNIIIIDHTSTLYLNLSFHSWSPNYDDDCVSDNINTVEVNNNNVDHVNAHNSNTINCCCNMMKNITIMLVISAYAVKDWKQHLSQVIMILVFVVFQ